MRILWVASISLVLLAVDKTLAAWGAGGCGPVGPPARPVLARLPVETKPRYTWKTQDDYRFTLLDNDVEVAVYDWDTDLFTWKGKLPEAPPWGRRPGQAQPASEAIRAKPLQTPAEMNFGIDLPQLHTWPGGYYVNEHAVSKKQAEQVLQGAGPIPDDKDKLRLTVIAANEAKRKKVVEDVLGNPLLLPWKEKVVVQDYPPDHWAVARAGFQGGDPAVYLQDAQGKVLHKQLDYADGPAGLATALRKATPDYKPDLDPDKRKNPVVPGLPDIPLWGWVGGLGLLLLLLLPAPAVE